MEFYKSAQKAQSVRCQGWFAVRTFSFRLKLINTAKGRRKGRRNNLEST